jgi:hypothetical protein
VLLETRIVARDTLTRVNRGISAKQVFGAETLAHRFIRWTSFLFGKVRNLFEDTERPGLPSLIAFLGGIKRTVSEPLRLEPQSSASECEKGDDDGLHELTEFLVSANSATPTKESRILLPPISALIPLP